MTIKIKKLNDNATIPTYAHETDSGFDLYAADDVLIEPGETALVSTGIAIDIPEGFEVQVRPRSGITRKTKLRVQLGTIDEGYTGDIGIIVDNIAQSEYDIHEWSEVGYVIEEVFDIFVNTVSGEPKRMMTYNPVGTYLIQRGDKIAQGVLAPVAHATFVEVDEFDGESARGANGFGSSGVRKEPRRVDRKLSDYHTETMIYLDEEESE